MELKVVKDVLSVALSTAGGAFVGYLAQHNPGDLVAADWKPVLLGGAFAAMVALFHLYSAIPGTSGLVPVLPSPPEQEKK